MNKHKSKNVEGRAARILTLIFVILGLLYATLLQGTNIALFNPKGYIANEQLKLLLISGGILFAIAIPTIALMYRFAWKYRESNDSVDRTVGPKRNGLYLSIIWAIPLAVFVLLSTVMWSSTQRLEPQKAIASAKQPMTIQVVALQWKWLFIYPKQQIASLNYVQIPKDTPVRFELTADEAPMSSFWIPQLAGQLYAMTGHVNPLNLIADTTGDYQGRSAEINGIGFADMKFTARVSSEQDFKTWTDDVRLSGTNLDGQAYQQLLKPTENDLAGYYSSVDAALFANVIQKYNSSHQSHSTGSQHEDHE